MISAGTGSVKQQFYEKGSLEAIDWGEVAGKSTVGGIIGVGTSYGGAKLSQGTTYLLSKNATVSSLLYSESAATRAASNFVVSGTTEVVSGVGTRFAGGVLTTGGNVKEAWAQAINPQSIIFDAALGGATGGVQGLKQLSNNKHTVITDGSHLDDGGNLKPNSTYKTGEHDYIYQTNEDGLITHAQTDNLQLKTHEGRLNHNPNTPGKLKGDHAGHLFGDIFGGSPELDNLVSQAQQVNLSEYKKIENQWAKALEEGQHVTVEIDIHYDVGNTRPTSFEVFYTIDDIPFYQTITQ